MKQAAMCFLSCWILSSRASRGSKTHVVFTGLYNMPVCYTCMCRNALVLCSHSWNCPTPTLDLSECQRWWPQTGSCFPRQFPGGGCVFLMDGDCLRMSQFNSADGHSPGYHFQSTAVTVENTWNRLAVRPSNSQN